MADINEKQEDIKDIPPPPTDKKTPLTTSLSTSSIENRDGGINEKALLRKLDLRLLPALTVLYLLSFLDRSNGILASITLFNGWVFLIWIPC